MTPAGAPCVVGGTELQVSRRHTRELRDRPASGDQPRRPARPTGEPSARGDRTRHRAAAARAGPGDQSPRRHAAVRGPVRPRDRGDRRADRARRGLHGARCCAPSSGSALRCCAAPRSCSAGCRCCSSLVPGHQRTPGAGGCRCRGCVLGVLVYPVLRPARRWLYVRQAERNERDFAELVDGAAVNATYGVVAVVLVCLATLAIGAFGLRFSRTTSDFFVASRTVSPALERLRDRRRVPLGRLVPGVAGLVLASAPTCCGSRSAGPPATSCCWSWWRRRCAARAPTRCPTSPRPGWSRRAVRHAGLACWWSASAGST